MVGLQLIKINGKKKTQKNTDLYNTKQSLQPELADQVDDHICL